MRISDWSSDVCSSDLIVLTGAINQRVLVDPAESRGIGTKGGRNAGRQLIACLAQVFEHARARPIQIGAVIEQHIDVGVAKERKGTHSRRAGHRENRSEENKSELQSLMRNSYAVFFLKKKTKKKKNQ